MPTERMAACALAGLALLFTFVPATFGHTPSETYFTLNLAGTNLLGRWDVALRDLHQGIGLDVRRVQEFDTTELQRREEAMALDIAEGLEIKADGTMLKLRITDYTTLPLNGIGYARLLFEAGGVSDVTKAIEINVASAFRIDTNMHGLLRLEHDGHSDAVAFDSQHPTHRFELGQPAGRWARWLTFVGEGLWHIWMGFDHILFLVAMLLPAVLRWEVNRWLGVERFRSALMNVFKIVTAFTVAHSVTLSLSALGIVRLPTRLVEAIIAASVALAASNNLWPWFRGRGWLVAFGFGLIHGFGFANVLIELQLAGGVLALALVGFNVGVELGQLAIVIMFLPLAFGLRQSWFYRTITLKIGSMAIALVALTWMIERLFGLQLMGF